MNGFKNGDNESTSGPAAAAGCPLQWKVGLVNSQGRYLTAETFGCKINASGTVLRKKQLWVIEYHPTEDDTVYIRSHLGRYLAGDKRGNATCSTEEAPGEAERFSIEYNQDGSGRWAIRNRATGYYFGGTEDRLLCYEKQPGATEWWTVHLAFHPQVNLRNVNRQKYACLHLADAGGDTGSRQAASSGPDQLRISALIPWGEHSLVTLEFVDGRYAVRTCDDRYLHRDGSLVAQPGPDTAFAVELKSGGAGSSAAGLALRDRTGKYLTAVGRDAVMQARNATAGKDELFVVEESHPQVVVTAHNGKMVSIKQGVDPTANQEDEVTDRETFQLEFDRKAEQWRIRTADNKYWSVEAASGIQAVGGPDGVKGLFAIEWLPDGQVALKATANGRYLTARMNGSLYAVSDEVADRERFTLSLVNRPRLILKCEHGYVGFKTPGNPRYECNKAVSDPVRLVSSRRPAPAGDGSTAPPAAAAAYYLKGQNDRYWMTDPADGSVVADSAEPQPFIIQLCGRSRMAIQAPNGNYISAEQNGTMWAKHADLEKATLWEY